MRNNYGDLSENSVTGDWQLVLFQVVRIYERRKGTYSLRAGDVMKNSVNSVMRGNASIRAATGLFRIPNITLRNVFKHSSTTNIKKRDITAEKSNPGSGHPKVFRDAEEKYLCDRFKDLGIRGLGCTAYQGSIHLCRNPNSITSKYKDASKY
jgi:hypothetical protein